LTQGESVKELEANLHEVIEGLFLAAEPLEALDGGRIFLVAV
jgi:predicted RNase H-like HicB family nuclease